MSRGPREKMSIKWNNLTTKLQYRPYTSIYHAHTTFGINMADNNSVNQVRSLIEDKSSSPLAPSWEKMIPIATPGMMIPR